MKHIKLFTVLLVALMLVFTACQTSAPAPVDAPTAAPTDAPKTDDKPVDAATEPPQTSAETAPPEFVELQFLAPSPMATINNMDAVMEEFYNRTKDTLNVKINYIFTTFDDIGQKVSLKLSSGEDLDCAFTAQWTNPSVMQMVSKGYIANLDNYFDSDAYPALRRAFSKEYLRNNTFQDANSEYHTYAIPFTQNFMGGSAVYYRKDLAVKYNIGDINDYDSLTAYFDAILQNEKGMTPFTFLGSADGWAENIATIYREPISGQKHNYSDFGGIGMKAAIREDNTAYVAKHFIAEMDPEYYELVNYKYDPLQPFQLAREWYEKGYIEKDILNQKDFESQFIAGKAASFPRGIDTYNMIEGRLLDSIPDAQLGIFVFEPGLRFNMNKLTGSDFKAWNFASLPADSKNNDRVMSVFNWLFDDRADHDLMELGIVGQDWEPVGEDAYKVPNNADKAKVYNFPGYVLTWNPSMVRYSSDLPQQVVSGLKTMANTDYFYKRPDAGFSFMTDPIATEQAKINDLTSLKRALLNGVIKDYEKEIARVQEQYEKAGYLTMTAELEKQFTEFLKDNPYEGQ